MSKKRLQLNVAITMFEKLDRPIARERKTRLGPVVDFVYEDEKELNQFGLEMKNFPADRPAVEQAFKDLKNMVLHELGRLGLMK